LRRRNDRDLSFRIHTAKLTAWKDINLTIVTPSEWLAAAVRRSRLFGHLKVVVIPNGLDTTVYRPGDRLTAREALKLPINKRLIMFSAWAGQSDSRKGFDLLSNSLERLTRDHEFRNDTDLVVVGGDAKGVTETCGFKTHLLGPVRDQVSLSMIYNAADAFVAPSREDNFPNTIAEALACGTPCVSFAVGGIPEMIRHRKNGYVAEACDGVSLADGIRWVLSRSAESEELRRAAREGAAREYSLELQAERYASLYSQLKTECAR
jgi:glycosyltransferase involved in cell wall biosynthesis